MMPQIIVLDRYEVVRAVLGDGPSACPILEDLHVEKLENAAITYEFAVPADHPDAQTIAPEGYVIIRDLDGLLQELRIKTVEDELDAEGKRIRRVTCENAALELNGSIVRPQTWTGVTASQALTNALTGTRWQPGIVEWSGTRTITIDGYKTVTEVLHQIASEFEAEIRWHVVWQDGRIVGRFVDLLRQRGRYTGKRFEYAKDITGLRRIEDTTELVTAMIGVGKADENGNRLTFVDVTWNKASGDPADKPAGQDWVGDEDALQRWGLPGGRHIFGIYDDPDEEDPNKLLQKTWNALQQRVNSRYTYEVEVALLERLAEQVEPGREPEYYSLQAQFYAQFDGQPLPRGASGWEHEAVRLGDTVTIHDTSVDPPLVLEARVIEVQRSYVDPTRDKVVLGYYRPLITTLPKMVADLQRRLNQKQGTWDSKQRPVAVGSTPPSNPQVNDLWVDTSSTPHVWKRWDGAAWQKATPTQAAEVGAETPEGAQQKADQAEQNAKNAVSAGQVPVPTSALQGAIDAAANQVKAVQGYVYMDGNGLVIYDKPIEQNPTKAVKLGSGGILVANSKDGQGNWIWRTAVTGDGIWAPEITVGTVLFDRIRGGTAILGGAGNGNGVLSVRNASDIEVIRLDNRGIILSNGAKLVGDSGVLSVLTFSTDWQRAGWWDYGGAFKNGTAHIWAFVPANFVVTSATLVTRVMSRYLTGWRPIYGTPDGYYTIQQAVIYHGVGANQTGYYDWPASSESVGPYATGLTNVTTALWGGSWSPPAGETIQVRSADVTSYIQPGQRVVFAVKSGTTTDSTNGKNAAAVQFELTIIGYKQ